MKRVWYVVVAGLGLALFVAPVHVVGSGGVVAPGSNVAQARPVPPPGGDPNPATPTPTSTSDAFLTPDDCVNISIPLINNGGKCVSNDPKTGGAVVNYLRGWLQLLSGLVGLVVMLLIVIGGVQYVVSAGDPGQVKAAKNRIINALTGLVLYLMMFAILQFLIPGGIL
jgi:Type IV secretion system pilin